MQAIETMIFLGVAILIGSMMYFFITTNDFFDVYKDDAPDGMKRVSKQDFAAAAVAHWKDCGEGALSKRTSVYVQGDGKLNKSYMFDVVKENSLCNTLQSMNEDCGAKENVEMESITLPKVVLLECDPVKRKLIIS